MLNFRVLKGWLSLISFLTFAIASHSLFALSKAESSETELRTVMLGLAHTLEEFMPLLFDENAFSSPANDEKVHDAIITLDTLFRQAEPHFSNKPVTYHVSAQVMQDQLLQARKAFEMREKQFARQKLLGLTGLCSSCHIQDKKSKQLFSNVKRYEFPNDFAYGEFLFLTRDYEKATEFYDAFIKKANMTKDQKNVHIALERELLIYAQLFKNPKKAYEKLKMLQEGAKFSRPVQEDLAAWLEGLKEYIEQSGMKNEEIDYEKLDQYMTKHYIAIENQPVPLLVNEKEKIFYLMLRGSLHDYLYENPPAAQVPAILYWLAVCDRALNYRFDFSLADWYLKACVLDYPNDSFAPKCYKAYEDYLRFAYAGGPDIDFPASVKNELKKMKEKIK